MQSFFQRLYKPILRIDVPNLGLTVTDDDGRVSIYARSGSVLAKFARQYEDRLQQDMKELLGHLEEICKKSTVGDGTVEFQIGNQIVEFDCVCIEEKDAHLKNERKEVMNLKLSIFATFLQEMSHESNVSRFMQMINSYDRGSMKAHAALASESDPLIQPKIDHDRKEQLLQEYVEAMQSVEGRHFVDVVRSYFPESKGAFGLAALIQAAENLVASQKGETVENEEKDEITVTLSLKQWNQLKELQNKKFY